MMRVVATDQHRSYRRRAADDCVVVVPGNAVDRVIADAAVEQIIAIATIERVVSGPAKELVVLIIAVDDVSQLITGIRLSLCH